MAIQNRQSVSEVEALYKRFANGYKIYKEWDNTRIVRQGRYMYQVLADYPTIDRSTLHKAIQASLDADIRSAITHLAPQLRFEEQITPQMLKDSIMRKKYGNAAIDALYSNTARTMKKYENLGIDEKIAKYRFESAWVVKNRSFNTVKEVAAYYEREAVRLERMRDFEATKNAIITAEAKLSKYGYESTLKGTEYYDELQSLQKEQKELAKLVAKSERLDKISDFASTTRSTVLKNYQKQIDALITKEGITADIEDLLTKAENKIAELEKNRSAASFSAKTVNEIKATMGRNTPKTIENLQGKIDKQLSSSYRHCSAEQKRIYRERMLYLFENSDFGMNVPRLSKSGDNVIEAIFNSYFKAQQETGTGKGMVNITARKKASKDLFGTDIAHTQPSQYEKYGFLMDKDILKQSKSTIAGHYWSHGDGIQIRFKKEKVIATFTMADSLQSGLIPSLVTDPQLTSSYTYKLNSFFSTKKAISSAIEATKHWAGSYIELQYHGSLTLDCIDSIFVPADVIPKLSKDLLRKMAKYGKIYTTNQSKSKLIEYVP